MFHKALEININYVSFITFEWVGTMYQRWSLSGLLVGYPAG